LLLAAKHKNLNEIKTQKIGWLVFNGAFNTKW